MKIYYWVASLALAVMVLSAPMAARAATTEEIDRLVMIQDCTDLAVLYNQVLDTHDVSLLPRIFASDSVIDLRASGEYSGLPAITAFITKYGAVQTQKHRHFLSNIFIEADGPGKAKGSAYVADFYYDANDKTLKFFPVTLVGSFAYAFKRTPDGWRIARVTLERDRAAGESPVNAIRNNAGTGTAP
jgi:hypothetical protein